MLEQTLSIVFLVVGVYLAIGVIFAIIFLLKGVNKVDEGAKDAGFFFKLLIFPGCILFWIVLLPKWLKSKKDETITAA